MEVKDKFLKKPNWIKVRFPTSPVFGQTKRLMRDLKLTTVCEEAACPNIGECWSMKHATVMILGDTCTRACAFCNVRTGKPQSVDASEPVNVGLMALKLNLRHMVITSVDRDDLADGGAHHFFRCINEVRKHSPDTTVEVLTPDFRNKTSALETVIGAYPDVFNHNLETVPRLYSKIRPGARYMGSLKLLQQAKAMNKTIFTKSGIMVGLGEDKKEVFEVMDDLVSAEVDFLTIGQYLRPTPKHAKVNRYVSIEEFLEYKKTALEKGFLMVSASPLTRSSYHADQDFLKLKLARAQQTNLAFI